MPQTAWSATVDNGNAYTVVGDEQPGASYIITPRALQTVNINLTEVNGNNFSQKNESGFHPSTVIGEEIVETITINQLISDYDIARIDFLKVDCEGGELDLFRTIDKEYLQNNVGKIAMEYHSKEIYDEVLDILKSNNFIIEDTLGSNDIGLIYAYNINLIK